jgi:hypothetical protein
MSCPTCGSQGPANEEELLRRILLNMRYANPNTIERFFNIYTLGKKAFRERPSLLRDYMMHMFGPGQGGCALDLFIAIMAQQAEATA